MTPNNTSTLLNPAAMARLFALLLFATVTAFAQTTSPTDGSTPLGLSPGAPAGSYPLTGFENVNLFNGNLNFHLLLDAIQGRGSAQAGSMLAIDTKGWRIKLQQVVNPVTGDIDDIFTPSPSIWTAPAPGLGPGILVGRQSGGRDITYCGYHSSNPAHHTTLTRLTFTASDGTGYELRDQQTNGQPLPIANPCSFVAPTRGTVFVTADGSAATFISDTVISDKVAAGGPGLLYPSGYLMLRDGTRYRIDGGNVTWMRDRNGNKISFTYTDSRVTSITDSLNRQVTITYGSPSTQISFKGFGGAARTILINYGPLGNALRTTNPRNEPASRYQLQTHHGLFPELNGSSNTSYNPGVVSSVTLPNGQQYQFFYNSFAELARVNLPTGGAIEYDYTAGSGLTDEYGDYQVYRRVIERRVYSDGLALEGYTTYVETVSGLSCTWPEPCQTEATITVDHRNSGGALLARDKHYFHGDAVSSLFRDGASYPLRREGREFRTESYNADGTTLLRRSETTWVNRAPVTWWPYSSLSEPPNDPRATDTTTTIADVSPNLVSRQTFGYDDSVPYNNQNNVKEYDFGSGAPGALLRETRTTFITSSTYTGTSVHQRSLPSQTSVYDAGGTERARATMEYDNYTADTNHAALLSRANISGFDASFSTSYTTRGNPTGTTQYLLVNGAVTGSVTGYAQYDIAGNVIKAIDARGNATTITYADCFGAPDGNARLNGAPLELSSVSQFSYALPTSVTNSLNQTTYSQFDYYTGRPVDGEDANGTVASGYYNDLLDRPTQVRRAVGTSLASQTSFSYDDVNRVGTTTGDLNANNDNLLKSQTLYDGLGRTIESRQYESATAFITTKKTYDALGRAFKVSNPFRPWQSEVAIWTTTAFDALGRLLSVTTPDTAVVTTSYSGNGVTVTDQIGKKRKSVTDGLGRLKEVYEDPTGLNYLTSYNYDTLDNLTSVSQGSQTRTFVYNSLKRLTSATNPESGTICYGTIISGQCQANGYDANGNLIYKTDARGVLASYTYDALNRNTLVDYSDATPDSYRQYDLAINGKGRINQIWQSGTNTSATYVDQYDALGRPVIQRQRYETAGVWSASYQVQRTYDLAGHVRTQTYPSGHSVTYNYDAAGRLGDKDAQNLAFTGNLGDGFTRNYSSEILYSPLGGMTKEKFGTDTALYNKLFYNSRGQLAEIREGTSYTGPNDTGWERGAIINYYGDCWGMCGGSNSTTPMTNNNGNLKKQEIFVPGAISWLQQYDYDNLNRLQGVSESTGGTTLWRQEYVYDRYGNRTIHQTNTWGSGINKKDFTVNTGNNRLGPAGQTGVMSYDAAGNLSNDTYTGAGTRTYDAENRMTTAWGGNNQSQVYNYNADGQRTRRKVDGVETWQVYGMDGELVAEYAASAAVGNPQKEYGYRNGQLLITADAPARSNVALSANGGNATASSTTPVADGYGTFEPLSANNGDHRGLGIVNEISSNSFWRDGTNDAWPDWLQIDFNGNKTIDEIDVYSLQDNYASPVEPTESMTFSTQGLVAFDVQYWNGGAWVTVTGGVVTGNNKVWKKLTFTAVTTSKIRVVVNSALNHRSRVVEVEAWTASSAANINWLVTDQLGTPRMTFDKTGALATTKRHDYLPFGEEIFAGTGGRTSAQGYGAADGVRQKFTSKERDIETGLDYFGARYYGSIQGRFISTDPKPVTKESFLNPQRWHLYTYVNNSPLTAVDPNGGNGQGKGGDKVISVFLDYGVKQLGRNVTTDSRTGKVMKDVPNTSDWQATQKGAPSGTRVDLYGSNEVTGNKGLPKPVTDRAYENALSNSNAVIYVGHGRGDLSRVPFQQQGIQVGATFYGSKGSGPAYGVATIEGGTAPATGSKPDVTASVVVNLSCDANSQGGAYFNFVGQNQVMVTINSAGDGADGGITTFDALDKAANAFVKTYAGTGDVQKAVDAANKELAAIPGKGRENVGDTIKGKKVN